MNETKDPRTGQRFALAFALTLAILAVEVVGGLVANSLALLSDAGHVVTDVFALGLGWFAVRQAARPANASKTWGYHRAGIVVAFVNALTLLAITVIIIVEAITRLQHPATVQPLVMGASALFGIGMNLVIARFLGTPHAHAHDDHAGHDHKHELDLNTRAALLHVLGDVGASVSVILAAILIALTHAAILDAVISCAIALVVGFGAWRVGRDAVNLLLEGVPKGLTTEGIKQELRDIQGVYEVHDLHVWGITDTQRALTCHAVIDDIPINASAPLLDRINHMLRDRYGIAHTTVQFERRTTRGPASLPCACSVDCDCVGTVIEKRAVGHHA
ncbi:MAG: cation transporter [Ktedonobacterales bacterium]|nr:cation transporter [Ktedonobacterales bacterium]